MKEIPNDQDNSFERFEQHLEQMSAAWDKVGNSKSRLAEFIQRYGKQQADQMQHIYGVVKTERRIKEKALELKKLHAQNGETLDRLGDLLKNM